jgi:hypothetical protein
MVDGSAPCRAGTIGAGALVALAVPPDRLDRWRRSERLSGGQSQLRARVGTACIRRCAENSAALQRVIRQIETASGCRPALVLRWWRITASIGLIVRRGVGRAPRLAHRARRPAPGALERKLGPCAGRLAWCGLPALARQAGLDEASFSAARPLIEAGVIRPSA